MHKGGLLSAIDVATSERAIAVALMDHGPATTGAIAIGFYSMLGPPTTNEVHFRGVPQTFIEGYEHYDHSADPVLGWVTAHHAVRTGSIPAMRKASKAYDDLLHEHDLVWFGELMVAPIVVGGDMAGLMYFVSRGVGFTPEAVVLASALSLHVSGRIAVLRSLDSLALAWDGALTRREHEVAMVAAQGSTTAQIAHATGVSVNTIKKHLKRVYEKLDVQSRAELGFRLLRGPAAIASDKEILVPRPRKLGTGTTAFSHTVAGDSFIGSSSTSPRRASCIA